MRFPNMNFHTHTTYCDGKETAEQMVQAAIAKGFTRLGFSGHGFNDFRPEDQEVWCMRPEDVPKYQTEVRALAEKYQDKIEILCGVEQDACSTAPTEGFDYVIGSIHLVNSRDPYYPSFFEGREEQTAYREYFEFVLQNLKSYTNFDSLGHLDYVVRYGPTKNENYAWTQYREILDAILRILIKNEIALEVNTGGYKYGLGEPNPCTDILKRYKELGGKLLTIGSDAHDPAYLAYEFSRLRELLISCGFSSYYIFKKRAPMELPL